MDRAERKADEITKRIKDHFEDMIIGGFRQTNISDEEFKRTVVMVADCISISQDKTLLDTVNEIINKYKTK